MDCKYPTSVSVSSCQHIIISILWGTQDKYNNRISTFEMSYNQISLSFYQIMCLQKNLKNTLNQKAPCILTKAKTERENQITKMLTPFCAYSRFAVSLIFDLLTQIVCVDEIYQ